MNVRRWWPPVAWAALVLLLNSIPGSALPAGAPGTDKVGHVLLYGILGVLATRAALREARGWRAIAPVLFAIALFSAVDELHQTLVPGRSPEIRDWIADVVGASAGAATAAALMQRHKLDA